MQKHKRAWRFLWCRVYGHRVLWANGQSKTPGGDCLAASLVPLSSAASVQVHCATEESGTVKGGKGCSGLKSNSSVSGIGNSQGQMILAGREHCDGTLSSSKRDEVQSLSASAKRRARKAKRLQVQEEIEIQRADEMRLAEESEKTRKQHKQWLKDTKEAVICSRTLQHWHGHWHVWGFSAGLGVRSRI